MAKLRFTIGYGGLDRVEHKATPHLAAGHGSYELKVENQVTRRGN